MLQISCRHAADKAEIQPLVRNQTSTIEKCQGGGGTVGQFN